MELIKAFSGNRRPLALSAGSAIKTNSISSSQSESKPISISESEPSRFAGSGYNSKPISGIDYKPKPTLGDDKTRPIGSGIDVENDGKETFENNTGILNNKNIFFEDRILCHHVK